MFNWITGFVDRSGYIGILFLMLAENLFPPIPSELIMPLAGFAAAQGKLSLPLVLLAGTAGSLFGALFWYAIGRWIGEERLSRFAARHGRWLTLSPDDLDRAKEFFARHRHIAVVGGRLIPAVRTLISVPAGITSMPLPAFIGCTALGTAIWTAILTAAGYALQSQYQLVASYLNPLSDLVGGLLVAWYIFRIATFHAGSN